MKDYRYVQSLNGEESLRKFDSDKKKKFTWIPVAVIMAGIFLLSGAFSILISQDRNQTILNEEFLKMKSYPSQTSVQRYTLDEIANALGLDPEIVISADFGESDKRGYRIFNQVAAGFPRNGDSFLAISNGCADLALETEIEANVISCVLDEGPLGPGNATDIVQLELKLKVPEGATSLTFDFKFFSEEFPLFIGSSYNDGFVVEVGESTFTVDGSNLIAPDNIVFDENGNPITINDAGTLGQNASWAAGTIYGREANGGATRSLETTIPLTADTDEITLIFSIFDVQDRIYDSTVFLDDFRFDIIEENDIELVGVEVIQSIQNWNNEIPLIEGKPTLIRAHVQSQTSDSVKANLSLNTRISGSLLYLGGSEMLVPPITSDEKLITERRANLFESINFSNIDSDILSGKVVFELRNWSGEIDCPESAPKNEFGNCEFEVEFEPVPDPRIKIIRYSWIDQDGNLRVPDISEDEIDDNMKHLISMLPIKDIDYDIYDKDFAELRIEQPDPSDIHDSLVELSGGFNQYIPFGLRGREIYYAFIDGDWGGLKGEARTYRFHNTYRGGISGVQLGNKNSDVFIHEIAHLLSLPHIVNGNDNGIYNDKKIGYCGNNLSAEMALSFVEDFPYARDDVNNLNPFNNKIPGLGPFHEGSNNQLWGINLMSSQPRILGAFDELGKDYADTPIMSYCWDRFEGSGWISKDNYLTVLNHIKSRYNNFDTNKILASIDENYFHLSESKEYLIVRGEINLDEKTVEFKPFLKTESSNEGLLYPESADYMLVALNSDNDIIEELPFNTAIDEDSFSNSRHFQVFVDFSDEISKIQIRLNNTGKVKSSLIAGTEIIGSIDASENSPIVSILEFEGDLLSAGNKGKLEWFGEDSDGDELTYSIFFSSDNGISWQVIAASRSETSLTIDPSTLPRTEVGLFKVRVSDGFNVSEVVTDEFVSIPNTPPKSRIRTPLNEASYDTSETITLRGSGTDLEDGRLEDASLQWRSNIDGIIGEGRIANVSGRILSRGDHIITLSVTDSDGATSEVLVEIEITAPSPVTMPSNRPEIQGSIPNQRFEPNDEFYTIDLNEIFYDPTETGLSFESSSTDENVAKPTLSGDMLTIEPGVVGIAEISVLAENNDGSTEIVFRVTVGEPFFVNLNSPNNEELNVPLLPELSWLENDQANSYQFQLSKDEIFESVELEEEEVLETVYTVQDSLEYNTEYYWRVKVIADTVDGEWSETWSFTTMTSPLPAMSDLIYPSNNQEEVELETEFKWTKSENADTYQLQLSLDQDFNQIQIDTSGISDTTLVVENLEELSEYYWRVLASNDSGESDWSETWSFETQMATSVQLDGEVPKEVSLKQNYPNPFNPTTIITFGLPQTTQARLEVFNILGRRVALLVDEPRNAGYHEVSFDASNLSSGVYLYRLKAGDIVRTEKMMLIK